jgi:Na+/pantothenate symporter
MSLRGWLRGLALFTVYPAQSIVLLGTHRSRDFADPVLDFLVPEMYWYGWTASAAVCALVIGLIAALLPDRLSWFWAWCMWIIPPMAMAACVYLTIPWFRL